MSQKIGVALFGLGRIGKIHFRNIMSNSKLCLYYVVDENVEDAESEISSFTGGADIKVTPPSSAEKAFKDDRVQAVLVCTPTSTHFSLVQEAIIHGKHVFCEKPVSERRSEIAELYDEASKRGVHLFCSFNRRFDTSLVRMHQAVRSGSIGKILTVKTCSRDHPFPEISYLSKSNGIFHDCAIHDIDVVCWLYDQLPSSVYVVASANLEAVRNIGDVDAALVSLKFPGGGLACIDVGRISNYGYDQRVEAHGIGGMLVSENHLEHGLRSYGSSGSQAARPLSSFTERYRESYSRALDHFVLAVQEFPKATADTVTRKDCLRACTIADACSRSLTEGTPVTMAWDDSVF